MTVAPDGFPSLSSRASQPPNIIGVVAIVWLRRKFMVLGISNLLSPPSSSFLSSEFSDIFDLNHFKKVLANDVRIVSSLPSTHLTSKALEEKRIPVNVTPQ